MERTHVCPTLTHVCPAWTYVCPGWTYVCPRWYWNLGKPKLPKIQDCVWLLGCFFGIFVDPLVKKLETNMSKSILRLDIRMSRLDIRMSKLTTGVGHTYVQATNIPIGLDIILSAWTYVCPTPTPRLDIHMSNPIGILVAWTYVCPTWTYVCPTWLCFSTYSSLIF